MVGTAVVTGASSGIGRTYAEQLAAKGMDLVLVARRADRLDAVKRDLARHDVSVRTVVADLGNADDVQRLIVELETTPVELLVNNAALAHYMPFAQLPAERARELVDLNVLAPVLLTRAVVPAMIKQGHGAVVNVASLLAFSGAARAAHLPNRAVYAATKAFLVTFSQILAGELAGTGVTVQVLCPGVVRTEFHSRQGIDMSQVPRMEPEQIVAASLHDLERGVVVSIPALGDESAKAHFDDAARACWRLRVARISRRVMALAHMARPKAATPWPPATRHCCFGFPTLARNARPSATPPAARALASPPPKVDGVGHGRTRMIVLPGRRSV